MDRGSKWAVVLWGHKESNRRKDQHSSRNQRAQVKEFSAFLCICMELRKSLIIEVIPVICICYLQPASWFFLVCFFISHILSHPTSPHPQQSLGWGDGHGASICWILGIIFLWGALIYTLETPNHWWLLHPHLLRRQKIFHFTFKKSISEKFGPQSSCGLRNEW